MKILNDGNIRKYYIRIIKFFVLYSIVIGLFTAIGARIAGLRGGSISDVITKTTLYQQCIIFSIAAIGTILLLWHTMRRTDKEPFMNLGLQTKYRLNDIIWGLVVGFIIMALAFFLLSLSNQVSVVKINYNANLFYSVWFFVVISFVEELIFRAYILRNLMYAFDKYFALIISSLMFSTAHFVNPNFNIISFLSIFFAGIMLGISYIYTKNLWFPIALHFSWNFFQTFFGFNVSGIDSYSFIQIKVINNNVFSGGAFGFEGSVLSLFAELFIIAFIVSYKEKFFKSGSYVYKFNLLN